MDPMIVAGAPDQELLGVHIFRAGKYQVVNPDGTREWHEYTEADVKQMADNANKMLSSNLHEPPMKIGHDDDQALAKMAGLPAVGWTKRVIARGKDLFADFQQVPALMAEAIRRGRYKKISSEIYNPDQTKANFADAVKGFTLRAVAILGADVPVVKGMNSVTLNPLMLGEGRAFCAAEGGQIVLEVIKNMDDPTKFGGALMAHVNRHPMDAFASMKDKKSGAKSKVKVHAVHPDDTYDVHDPATGAVTKGVAHDDLTLLSETFNPEDPTMSAEAIKLAEDKAKEANAALLAEQTKTKALQATIRNDRLTAFAEKHKGILKQPPIFAALKALAGIEVASPVKLAEGGKDMAYFDAMLEFAEQVIKAKPVLFGETIPDGKEDNVEQKTLAVKLAEKEFETYAESHGNPKIQAASIAVAARAAFAENPKQPYRVHLLAEAAKRLGKYAHGKYAELTQEVA